MGLFAKIFYFFEMLSNFRQSLSCLPTDDDDLLSYYIDNFVNDEFIEHWMSYSLDILTEKPDNFCQLVLVVGDTGFDRLLYAGVIKDSIETGELNYLSIFANEEAAKNYLQEEGTILGDEGYKTLEGNIVYEESVKGNIKNNIANAPVSASPTYKSKIDFIKQAFNEIYDFTYLSLVLQAGEDESNSFMLDIYEEHSKDDLTSLYCTYSVDNEFE